VARVERTVRNARPPPRKYAGVAKPSVDAGGVKPGQRRRAVMRGGLRTLSRRGSGVRIPAPAPFGRVFGYARPLDVHHFGVYLLGAPPPPPP